MEGRVEISYNDEWGTVCDDMFDDVDADVVCRQLGFVAGRALTDNEFGEGSGTIWLDSVECQGTESEVGICDHSDWGVHDCNHSEDVGVICGKQKLGTPIFHVTIRHTFYLFRFHRIYTWLCCALCGGDYKTGISLFMWFICLYTSCLLRWHWDNRTRGPFYWDWLTFIIAWIRSHMPNKMWFEITCPFPNFNVCAVEFWEWISNFIPHCIRGVIIYPRWDQR